MAYIRKLPPGKWQATVRRFGELHFALAITEGLSADARYAGGQG